MARQVNHYGPPPPSPGPFHPGDPQPTPYPPYAPTPQAPGFYPITIGRAVSLSFSLYRFSWRTLVPISVLATLPSALATAAVGVLTYQSLVDWEQSVAFDDFGNASVANPFATLPLDAYALILVVSAVVGLFPFFGLAAISDAVGKVISGQRLSVRGSGGAAIKRWRSLLAIYLAVVAVSGLLPLAGSALPGFSVFGPAGIGLPGPLLFLGLIAMVALIFGLAFVAIRIALVIQSLMIEDLPAAQALRRSWTLVAGSMWRLVGWALMFVVIVGLLSIPFSFAITILGFVIAPPHLTAPLTVTFDPSVYFIQLLLTTLVSAALLPLVDIGFVLLYFDLRWRHGDKVPVPGGGEIAGRVPTSAS